MSSSSTLSPPATEIPWVKIESPPVPQAPQSLDEDPPTKTPGDQDGSNADPSIAVHRHAPELPKDAALETPGNICSPGSQSKDPAAPSKIPMYIGMLKRGFELLAKNVEPCLEGTPFKIPIAALNAFIDLANSVSGNNSAVKDLLEQTSHRLDVVNSALIKAQSDDAKERVYKFIQILLRETGSLDELLQRPTWEKVVQSNHDVKTIIDVVTRIDQYLKDFQIDVIMSIERNTEDMRAQLNAMRMESWPLSKHATYGADIDSTLLTREACTPHTRVSILVHIKQWVEDPSPDCSPVFWLTGHAGSGKSTIAFSISQHYDLNSDLLAANFFCSGQFEDTRSRKYIIPSIVHQLARHSSSFRRALIAIDQFESPEEVNKQMNALLIEPWKECMRRRQFRVPPLLVVIDALDEIDGGGSIFLQELLQVIHAGHLFGLKFLVTSRPDPGIVALCGSLPPKVVCRLQEVDMADVDQDITTFLHAKLPALKDEPAIKKLAQRSNGLFIYAATAVRYSTPRPKMTKAEQLDLIQKLLNPSSTSDSRNVFLIDELYKQILWTAFCNLEDAHFAARLGILHSILSDKISAPLHDIATIHATTEETIQLVVHELHAVLYTKDDLICWYHASFPDFIFDSKRSKFTVELSGNRTRLQRAGTIRIHFEEAYAAAQRTHGGPRRRRYVGRRESTFSVAFIHVPRLETDWICPAAEGGQ
ncbi:hypothetical protein FB451DRAFT_1567913 [Mycena latifolia]|nr:hypothetical protein FB451DRAFT_1567913 [Mycena latifolia]